MHGPPGTGKSQTIANLIAAALANGQSVLFVAEKRAALDVVRRRLNSCDLGHFALELHSHKANKSQLHSDLEARMKMRFRSPRRIAEHKADLQETKNTLLEYSDAASALVGPDELPYQEVVWRAGRHRAETGPLISNVPSRWAGPTSRAKINSQAARIGDYARLWNEIPDQSKTAWTGLDLKNALPSDLPGVIERLSYVENAASAWATASETAAEAGLSKADSNLSLSVLRKLPDILHASPIPIEQASPIWPAITQPDTRELLKSLDSMARQYKEVTGTIEAAANFTSPNNDAALSMLERAADMIMALGLAELTIPQLDLRLRDYAATFSALNDLNDAAAVAGEAIHRTASYLSDWKLCLELESIVNRQPPVEVSAIPAAWFQEGVAETVHTLVETSTQIASSIQDASGVFRDRPSVSSDQLRESVKILKVAHSKSFTRFRSEFRAHKRDLAGTVYDTRLLHDPDFTTEINNYADVLERKERFENDAQNAALAGSRFSGIRTPWKEVGRDLEWVEELTATLGDRHLAQEAFLNIDKTRVRASQAAAIGHPAVKTLSEQGTSVLTENQRLQPISSLAILIRQKTSELKSAIATLKSAAPPADTNSRTLAGVVKEKRRSLEIKEGIQSLEQELPENARSLWRDFSADTAEIMRAVEWAEDLVASGIPGEWIEWAGADADAPGFDRFSGLCRTAQDVTDSLDELKTEIFRLGRFDLAEWLGTQNGEFNARSLHQHAKVTISHALDAKAWAQICAHAAALSESSHSEWTFWVHENTPSPETAEHYYKAICWENLARDATTTNPTLANFVRLSHEQRVQKFCELDHQLKKLQSEEISYTVSTCRVPPRGTSSGRVGDLTELSLIQHELGKKRAHIPVRRLVQRAGSALQALKPCFLMSPMSVAQFLAPGQLEFDLIVIDEASQVKPEEALGALMRGERAIIVGDPKQLPPTSFFDRSIELDIEPEDLAAAEEAESILEVARTAFPNRLLQWHYRSEHHSLIAFSNSEFYQGDLVVFPAPQTGGSEYGIRRTFVEGAQYQSSRNPAEALAVAEGIREHLVSGRRGSLGIATFNSAQRDLILEEIERLQKVDPLFDHSLRTQDAESDEPLFVKNLENVQGDERDVIYISTTYGPDTQTGKVYQRFGPLAGVHGWRRLNVILTRARRRIELFTSLRSSDILAGENSARGVVSLRKFLEYAETGLIPDLGTSSGEPENDFEVDIATELTRHGYEVEAQIGVAGFFIDIGVKDPRGEGYILGIECDGATYHSSKSARDRDRLRQEILEHKGWKIHRIWSTDWFKNRETEIARLCARVEAAISEVVPPRP